MKIKKLEIENFKLFDSNFDQINEIGNADLILLNGPNGYGKTTVFDALELALTGQIKRILDYNDNLGVKKNEKSGRAILIADPSKEAYVRLTLEEGGSEFQLERFYEKPSGTVEFVSSVENNPNTIFDKFKRRIIVSGEEISGEENQIAFLKKHHLDHVTEFFDKCCFLSQDEHLQFLKESRTGKSDALQFLFQLPPDRQEELDKVKRMIYSLKNSNRTNNLGYLTKLENNRGQLESIIKDLEDKFEKDQTKENAEREAEYQCLFPEKKIKWDQKTPVLTDEEFGESFGQIENLIYYAKHQEECQCFIWNKPLQELMMPFYGGEDIRFEDRPLEYACRYYSLVQKGEDFEERYQKEQRLGQLGKNLEKREIHKIDWKVISDEQLMEEDVVEYMKEQIAQVKRLQQIQGTAERVLSDIVEARNVLFRRAKQAREQEVIEEGECPFCGRQYGKDGVLEEKIAEEEKKLLAQSRGVATDIQNRMDELFEKYLNHLLDDVNKQLQNRVSEGEYQRYQEAKKYIGKLNEIGNLLQKINISLPMEHQEDIAKIHQNYENLLSMMEEKVKKIPKDIEMKLEEKGFWMDYGKYYDKEEDKFLQHTDAVLQNKYAYIEKVLYDSIKKEKEILNCKRELEKVQNRYKKLQEYYEDLCEYRNAIQRGIEKYKRNVIHDIEPLLHVYTAKILQQKFFGKSIFVLTDKSVDKIQLIHSSEDNQDILYNMSSGQLAAVSLSFLLCMHQVYARNQSLPILLIDDPIQTIDDVNMVGLVDILRFEFGDAQIFISTHEQKFEWYLKYKYAKAKKKIESYNMKDMVLQRG